MRRKDITFEMNQASTPLLVFLDSYNKSVPNGFPHASAKMLKLFQVAHPVLFKHGDEWSIDRHRKRLMDWLSSHRDSE